VDVLGNALVEELAERRDAEAENVGDDVGLEQLGRIAGEGDRALSACRRGAVAGDVKGDAGTRRVLGSCSGNYQQVGHRCQYAHFMRPQ